MKTTNPATRNGVYIGNEFRTLLDHEADIIRGNGHSATLLLLDVSRVQWNSNHERELMEAMSQRAGHAGVVGWIDGRHVGLLMMDRPYEGACRVAERIERDLSSRLSEVVRLDMYVCRPEVLRAAGPQFVATVKMHGSPYRPAMASGATTRESSPEIVGPIDGRPLLDESWEKIWSRMIAGRASCCVPPWKRLLDIVGASIALVILSPLMLLIVAGIKLLSPGPALFKQERVGHMGRNFICWKFRSMRPNANTAAHRQHLEHLIHSDKPMEKLDKKSDDRLLPWGKLLRSSGMDELPQLFNVLRGEMSLVGPRPCIPYEYEHYYPWHKKRFETLPGLTGLWQVSGKNQTTFNEMMHLDIEYVHKKTLWLDLRIIARTVPTIIREVRGALRRSKKRG